MVSINRAGECFFVLGLLVLHRSKEKIQRVSQKPKGIDAAISQELTGSRDPWRPRKPLSFSLVVSLHADFIPTLISLSPYAQHRKWQLPSLINVYLLSKQQEGWCGTAKLYLHVPPGHYHWVRPNHLQLEAWQKHGCASQTMWAGEGEAISWKGIRQTCLHLPPSILWWRTFQNVVQTQWHQNHLARS